MAKFDIVASGYSISEVEDYIDSLTNKYEKRLSEQKDKMFALRNENSMLEASLSDSKIKEEEVSRALLFAVEKSEQVEKGSKKIHDLEIRRLRLVYAKWKEVLSLIDNETLNAIGEGKFASAIKEFDGDINTILKQNENFDNRMAEEISVKDSLKDSSSNYIKNLLNRMDYIVSSQMDETKQQKKKINKIDNKPKANNLDSVVVTNASSVKEKKETAKLLNINRRFNKITSRLGLATGAEILNDEISEDNAYYRNLTKDKVDEDQFDLDAILNPKEDLAEIMKAFEEI